MDRRHFIKIFVIIGFAALFSSCALAESKVPLESISTIVTDIPQVKEVIVETVVEDPLTWSETQLSLNSMTMFRGNPERNLSGVGTVPRRPKLLWRFRTKIKYEGSYEQRGDEKLNDMSEWKGLGWTGQPCYVDGKAYYGSGDSYVYCHDARTGELLWYYPNHHCVKGSISVIDGLIYHGGRDNKIHCYNLNGQMNWETRTGNDMDSNPTVVDNRGFIGGEDRNIYSFDPESGEILWKHDTAGSVESSPCVVDDKVLAGSSQGWLYCLSTVTGEEVWKFRTYGDTDASPVHWDGKIYSASATGDVDESGHVWCVDLETGEEVWHVRMSRGVWATPAINPDKNAIYVGCANGDLSALSMDDGGLIWKRDLYSRIWSSPVVTDGVVLVGVRDGRFWCLDEDTGNPIWCFDDLFDFDATPCVADGLIIVGSQNGWVYCIGEAGEDEDVDTNWFAVDFPMPRRLFRSRDAENAVRTIDNPAPQPRLYNDTSAYIRDHYLEPVYGPAWTTNSPSELN